MKVSIVTPSFNQGEFIKKTIDSVISQVEKDIEIDYVVFDGGSTDKTVEILKGFGSKIRWVSKKDNGQTDAVNKGILATNGTVIGWLNSDDIYYPGAIQKIVNYFNDHPEVDVVYGMADHIDLEDHAFESYPTESWDFERLQFTCFICQPALFFRRRIVDVHGLLDESLNFCMDYEYWLRLGKAGVKFGFLEDKLAGSRLYADNKTLGSRVKVHKEINEMFKKKFGIVPDRWIYNFAHAKADQKILRDQAPRKYLFFVSLYTMIEAIKTNMMISKPMRKNLIKWFLESSMK